MTKESSSSLSQIFRNLRKKIFGHRTKCFVIYFNRPTFLLRLLEVLSTNPRLDVFIIDNCSRAECRRSAEAIADRFGARLISMDRNYGHTVVWDRGLSLKYARDEPYVVTDCDVIPGREGDWLALLEKGLIDNPEVNKVGLELNVSRIPAAYPKRAEVISHERGSIYRKVLSPEFQECAVDTTLALYRAGYHKYSVWGTDSNQWTGRCLSLRTVQPEFEADHLGWHLIPPYNEETLQYFEAIRSTQSGHWKE
jgi:hypothetical protein